MAIANVLATPGTEPDIMVDLGGLTLREASQLQHLLTNAIAEAQHAVERLTPRGHPGAKAASMRLATFTRLEQTVDTAMDVWCKS